MMPAGPHSMGGGGHLRLRTTILAVVAAGLLARLALLVLLAPYPLTSDAGMYHGLALVLENGSLPGVEFPPGVPYYLTVWHRLLGAAPAVSRLSMLPVFLALLWGVYRLGGRLAGPDAAGLAAGLLSWFPAYLHQSVEPLSQLPMAACLILAVVFTLESAATGRWAPALAAGSVLGLGSLVRPSSLLLLALAPLYLFLRTRRLRLASAAALAGALLVSLWLVKAWSSYGRFVPIADLNAANFFIGNNPYTPLYRTWWLGSHRAGPEVPPEYARLRDSIDALPAPARQTAWREGAWDHIRSHPGLFLLRTGNRVRAFWAFDTFTGSFARTAYGAGRPLVLLSIAADAAFYLTIAFFALHFLVFTARPRDEMSVLLAAVVLYAVPYWISFSHPTYHFPVVPLLAIPASVAALQCWRRRSLLPSGASQRRRIAWVLALLVLAAIQIEWIALGWRSLGPHGSTVAIDTLFRLR